VPVFLVWRRAAFGRRLRKRMWQFIRRLGRSFVKSDQDNVRGARESLRHFEGDGDGREPAVGPDFQALVTNRLGLSVDFWRPIVEVDLKTVSRGFKNVQAGVAGGQLQVFAAAPMDIKDFTVLVDRDTGWRVIAQ